MQHKFNRNISFLTLLTLVSVAISNPVNAQKERYIIDNNLEELLIAAKEIVDAGQTDSALQLFKKIHDDGIALNNEYAIIRSTVGLGIVHARKGEFASAQQYYLTALQLLDTSKYKSQLIASVYNNLGTLNHQTGNLHEAIKSYELALYYTERYSQSKIPLEMIQNNIASALIEIREFNKGLYYLEKAEELSFENGNKKQLIHIYQNYGAVYGFLADYKKAESFFLKCEKLAEELHIVNSRCLALKSIADIYLNTGDIDKALYYIQKAIRVSTGASLETSITLGITLGGVFLERKDYDNAILHFSNALQKADSYYIPNIQLDANRLLAIAYNKSKQYEKAYTHQQKAWNLSDSLKDIHKNSIIFQIESKYRTAQKDKELSDKELIISQQYNALQQRNIWIALSSIALLGLSSILFLVRKNNKTKQKLVAQNHQHNMQLKEIKEAQNIIHAVENERSRIARNLHDDNMIQFSLVKMSLSTLLDTLDNSNSRLQLQTSIKQLEKSMSSLRKATHFLMPQILLEGGLTEAVQVFCESIKEDANMDIRVMILDKIPKLDSHVQLVIYRCIQELLQNVLKHAEATEVYIQLSYDAGKLGIEVEDNGTGFNPHTIKTNTGLGIKNIELQILSLGGIFQIDSNPKGTTVYIEIDTLKYYHYTNESNYEFN